MRARTETEEIRSHLQQDIQELQNKLQVAEITLATSRQQPQQQQLQQQLPQQLQIQSNEMKPPLPPQQQQPQQQPIGTNIQLPYPMQPNEQQVGMVTLPSMPQMFSQQQPQMLPPQQHVAPYYAVNAGIINYIHLEFTNHHNNEKFNVISTYKVSGKKVYLCSNFGKCKTGKMG